MAKYEQMARKNTFGAAEYFFGTIKHIKTSNLFFSLKKIKICFCPHNIDSSRPYEDASTRNTNVTLLTVFTTNTIPRKRVQNLHGDDARGHNFSHLSVNHALSGAIQPWHDMPGREIGRAGLDHQLDAEGRARTRHV